VSDVRLIEVYGAEPLVPDANSFEAEIAVAKLKRFKSQGGEQILTELIQAGGETLQYENHKLIDSVWNKEQLSDQWKESITGPIYMEGDRAVFSNCRGILLLSTSYRMLSSFLPSKVNPNIDEVIGDHQYGFRRKRSTAYNFFHLSDTGRKWEYNETMHRLQDNL
jgi:hypothetical protein